MAAESELFTVVLVGPGASGKSTFLHYLVTGVFNPNIRSTIGIDFVNYYPTIQDRPIHLRFWDTAGDSRYHTITSNFLKKADEYFLCYDVSNRSSFIEATTIFLELIRQGGMHHVPITLIGIRKDKREVSIEEASELAMTERFRLVEIDLKTGDGICDLIHQIDLPPELYYQLTDEKNRKIYMVRLRADAVSTYNNAIRVMNRYDGSKLHLSTHSFSRSEAGRIISKSVYTFGGYLMNKFP